MKKSKFSETQIVKILKLQETGLSLGEICKQHGISQGTFYKLEEQIRGYGGLYD